MFRLQFGKSGGRVLLVWMFVGRPTPYTSSTITAREIWERHESLLEREFWNGGFWERSFYVRTTGEMSSRTVERYINRTEHV